VYIKQGFNLTEAEELVQDLWIDAQKYGIRNNSSMETAHASYIGGRFSKLIRQAKSIAMANNAGNRVKRNILGSLLHDVTGKIIV
jgi:hypothetical protein